MSGAKQGGQCFLPAPSPSPRSGGLGGEGHLPTPEFLPGGRGASPPKTHKFQLSRGARYENLSTFWIIFQQIHAKIPKIFFCSRLRRSQYSLLDSVGGSAPKKHHFCVRVFESFLKTACSKRIFKTETCVIRFSLASDTRWGLHAPSYVEKQRQFVQKGASNQRPLSDMTLRILCTVPQTPTAGAR